MVNERIREAFFKHRDNLAHLISEFERDFKLDNTEVIQTRKSTFLHLLDIFSHWSGEKDGDCIPEIVKLGAFGERYLYIFFIDFNDGDTFKELYEFHESLKAREKVLKFK